jgi:hypothetical protein
MTYKTKSKQQKRAAAISRAWARNIINGELINPSVQNVNLMLLNPASTNQMLVYFLGFELMGPSGSTQMMMNL